MPSHTPVKVIFRVPFIYVGVITLSLPIVSLFTVITLGVYLHHEKVTATHCKVPNIVPSISAVIGGVTPERYIWRLGIALYSSLAILISFFVYNNIAQCKALDRAWHRALNKLVWLLHNVQNFSLFGLTFVSSVENYLVHRDCFIAFVVTSLAHQLFLVLLFSRSQPLAYRAKLAFRLRCVFFIAHWVVFFTSIYFYWRHNTYCEPYMYSMYGFLEYLVVLTNVAFHGVQMVEVQNDYVLSIEVPRAHEH